MEFADVVHHACLDDQAFYHFEAAVRPERESGENLVVAHFVGELLAPDLKLVLFDCLQVEKFEKLQDFWIVVDQIRGKQACDPCEGVVVDGVLLHYILVKFC